jgi:preprotein translocase subunit SecG
LLGSERAFTTPQPRHLTSVRRSTRPAFGLLYFHIPATRRNARVHAIQLESFVALLAVGTWSYLLNAVIVLLGLLLILTILIQRGKGGGLIGAFGGAGGSSPFGSKAGDTFTRITITMAAFWVILIMIHVKVAKMDAIDRQTESSIIKQ